VAAWAAKAVAGAAAAAAERRWQRRRQTTAAGVRRRWKKMVFAFSQFSCQKRRPSVRMAELFPPFSEYRFLCIFYCNSLIFCKRIFFSVLTVFRFSHKKEMRSGTHLRKPDVFLPGEAPIVSYYGLFK
jgi:hypothetical protein